MQWHATIQEFLTSLQTERNTSANTIMAYRNDLSQFADYLNTALPEELTWTSLNQGHLSDFVASIASKYATSTIARKIAAIKTLFHWLHHKGLVSDDPSMRLKPPRIEKKAPRIMSEDEVFRLFEAASRAPAPRSLRDRALLELIYSTGMRVSEAIALRLSDVDFEA
ncbi:MAG: site-specific integrase, partial [Anaerolineae bacterium]|nr:site-specific integrase [Anaerolineae bacterium]